MSDTPKQITLAEWDVLYEQLRQDGLSENSYGGKLSRHVDEGDRRLLKLRYDNSIAALRLWNFLLTEEQRLHEARREGKTIIGTMKDLGTIPVMAYSLDNVLAFYPDGAWWIPCVMELSAGLLETADSLGIDESFCPVRAMIGAFVTKDRFPIPDKLICSAGAVCDDFSAIAQRLEHIGYEITWWEIPHRRKPEPGEDVCELPGGFSAPRSQVEFVRSQLHRIKEVLEDQTGQKLTDEKLAAGIRKANLVRQSLIELRETTFTARICPLGALEMLIAEMLAIHFCSDIDEAICVLGGLVEIVKSRLQAGTGVLADDAARIFWVNPVADLKVMNMLEECGGRVCGTEYLFSHALDIIDETLPPDEALAQMAISDPMAGPSSDRADRICNDIERFGSEAVLISRIPGASHCALEGDIISDIVTRRIDIPVVQVEVPPIADSFNSTLRTRLEALIETVKQRRTK